MFNLERLVKVTGNGIVCEASLARLNQDVNEQLRRQWHVTGGRNQHSCSVGPAWTDGRLCQEVALNQFEELEFARVDGGRFEISC